MEDEHHDHAGIYDPNISCIVCRRNFHPEIETHEAFDAICMCRDCKTVVFEDLGSNSAPRDSLQRFPTGLRARQQSEDSVEDLFLQEFSQLVNLARLNRRDRSLFRWRRALSDNESEGLDQVDSSMGENESNFSFGGYGGGSDVSLDGPSSFMDREVFIDLVDASRILANTNVDPMNAGLDSWNYEDQEEDEEEEEDNEMDEEDVHILGEGTILETETEYTQRSFHEAGQRFYRNSSRVRLAMAQENGFEEEEEEEEDTRIEGETETETETERIDRITREVGEFMDRNNSRVSWEMAQEVGFEEEGRGESEEENARVEGLATSVEMESEYARQLFQEVGEIMNRNNSRVPWEMSQEAGFEEEDSDEWEEEVASPGTARARRIFRALSQITDIDNSRVPWTIPQDGFLHYPNLFSELVEYDDLNERNLEELLEHLTETEGPSRRGAPPASLSFVENLPRLIFSEDQEKNTHTVCAICKDLLLGGVKVIQLPCLHFYHSDCILPWLSTRNSCPLCRHELPTDDLDYEQGKMRYLAETRVELQAVEDSSEESSDLEVEEEGPETVDFDGLDVGGSSRGVGGRGWLVLAAAAPIVGIVGAVLVLWLGKGETRMGGHGSWGGQLRQMPCSSSSDSTPASGGGRNRRWWPFF